MRHSRMFGLCLIAVFAIAGVFATTASAGGPEWGQCYAKTHGKYADANCTTKATTGHGPYEWRKNAEVVKKGFKGSGGESVLTGEYHVCSPGGHGRERTCRKGEEEEVLLGGPLAVKCASEQNSGEAVGTDRVANVSVTFQGCTVLGEVSCTNTAVEGEIHVNALKGRLGYINKAGKEVGVLLEPAEHNGRFIQFTCLEGLLQTVVGRSSGKEGHAYLSSGGGHDGIISSITPINTMTTAFTQKYTMNELFENIPQFETGKMYELESYVDNTESPEFSTKWSKSGQSLTNVNTSEEETEIKA
jgi:hypothetical protein